MEHESKRRWFINNLNYEKKLRNHLKSDTLCTSKHFISYAWQRFSLLALNPPGTIDVIVCVSKLNIGLQLCDFVYVCVRVWLCAYVRNEKIIITFRRGSFNSGFFPKLILEQLENHNENSWGKSSPIFAINLHDNNN